MLSAPFEGGAVDFSSSILSYSRDVETAICRLLILARIAYENMDATATSPQAMMAAVINASIKVNPRLLNMVVETGRGCKKVMTVTLQNQGLNAVDTRRH